MQKRLRNFEISESFPSEIVVNAFQHPRVREVSEEFKWENPDLDAIRSFMFYKTGWIQEKVDSFLKPVLQKLQERKTENLIIDHFFPVSQNEGVKKSSKRLKNAISKLSKRKKFQ